MPSSGMELHDQLAVVGAALLLIKGCGGVAHRYLPGYDPSQEWHQSRKSTLVMTSKDRYIGGANDIPVGIPLE